MKFIHTSDWHLGKQVAGQSQIDDQQFFIEQFLLPLCDKENPDAVLIAGDVFDRSIAPAAAIRLFDDFIYELCVRRGIRLLTSTGNHDGADRFTLGAPLLEKQGFIVAARLDPFLRPVTITACGTTAHVYMLPYFDPASARDCLPETDIRGFGDAYQQILDIIRQRLDRSAVNILMCHCFVSGAVSCDSESTLYIGGSGEVPLSVFESFDYVALGHLHSPQNIGGHVRYSGSPLPYSFDEEHQTKSVTVLEVSASEVTVRPVPVESKRRMRTITGTLENIIEAAGGDPRRNDYIYAVLQGPPIFEPMAKLREYYPYTLGLENGSRAGLSTDSGRDELRNHVKRGIADDFHIFREFMRQMCGEEPSDEDLAVFSEAVQKEGSR